jgi:predicted acylesterase/phospholipase RssA
MSQFQESLPSTGGKAQSFTFDSVRRTPHPQVVHDVALVLGGGGAAGNAWEIGIIAGLAEAGLDMTEAADLVIGTSSGATAAAHVRSGIPAAELLASVLSPPVQPVGQNRERPASLPMATVFDRDSGVDLVDAVTASTALPGMAPTHNVNGTHYINGGVRSADNADLASGYANVVVLSPFGGRSQTPPERGTDPAGQFEGLRRPPEWGTDLASQVDALRQQGSHVEVITPDADSRAAMGTNQMDPATRIPAARAGFAQGKHEATRVTFL